MNSPTPPAREKLPRLYIDKKSPGVIRIEGTDAMTGILAGMRAPEIVRRCNAHLQLVEALEYIRDLGADGADKKCQRAQAKAERTLAALRAARGDGK